jgi:hypothetical protein
MGLCSAVVTVLPHFRLSGLFVLGLQLLCSSCRERHVPPSPYQPRHAEEGGGTQGTLASASSHASGGTTHDTGPPPSLLPISWNNWTECYVGYAAGSNPLLDAFRLGLLCGPSNGLSLVTENHIIAAVELSHQKDMSWDVSRDDCWRWIVVAGPKTEQIAVTLQEPNGTKVAYLTPQVRYRVVPPRGPWCTPRAGKVGIRVTTWPAGGEVAYQAWRLR